MRTAALLALVVTLACFSTPLRVDGQANFGDLIAIELQHVENSINIDFRNLAIKHTKSDFSYNNSGDIVHQNFKSLSIRDTPLGDNDIHWEGALPSSLTSFAQLTKFELHNVHGLTGSLPAPLLELQ